MAECAGEATSTPVGWRAPSEFDVLNAAAGEHARGFGLSCQWVPNMVREAVMFETGSATCIGSGPVQYADNGHEEEGPERILLAPFMGMARECGVFAAPALASS